ncbi:MAG: hypothetical protein FJX76_12785 [Armatimonadetes bacterium]|nr:hypothetical protein [Armatimonadota bacterium]
MSETTTGTRYKELVHTIVTLLEGRNPFNLDHCKLVAHYSEALARRAGLDLAGLERLRHAAQLHTLGVLLQLEEKKTHHSLPATGWTEGGLRDIPSHEREEQILRHILGEVNGLARSIDIIVQRHEWFDGSGSLLGLRGEDILPEARMLSVADAFVDLATPKSHRDPVTLVEVLKRLREGSGSQFDPRYVDHLARYVMEEEERWGASARARRLEVARARHWLALGNFYRQSREAEWALRCYRAAEDRAEAMGHGELILESISGQFLTFCDMGETDRAHQVLTRARARAQDASGWTRQWYLLQWGLLEWQRGNEANGEQIVEGVLAELAEGANPAHYAAALAILSHMALVRRGVHDSTHLRLLGEFVRLLTEHDLFDVLVTYRPQTIPLLLSALVHDFQPTLARNLLTRMGEPCPGNVAKILVPLPPNRWMGALHPDSKTPTYAASADPDVPPVEAPVPVSGSTRVLCLGPLVLEAQSKRIGEDDWPTQKAMKLFAYLIHKRGASVSDQALMELLWPMAEEDKARNSLRNAVHQIRGTLKALLGEKVGPNALTRSRRTGTLALKMEAFVDVEAMEEAVRSATTMVSQARHSAAVAILRDALALYRGDFLESVRDDWAVGPRTRLSEMHLRGLDLLARSQLALGDAEAAEIAARRALSFDDLQEEGHTNLVEALVAQGRRTDALRHYQGAVVHFKKEIGLDAPARLVSAYDRLLK